MAFLFKTSGKLHISQKCVHRELVAEYLAKQ